MTASQINDGTDQAITKLPNKIIRRRTKANSPGRTAGVMCSPGRNTVLPSGLRTANDSPRRRNQLQMSFRQSMNLAGTTMGTFTNARGSTDDTSLSLVNSVDLTNIPPRAVFSQ